MHLARFKSLFLVILLVSSVGGFLNHKAYAATTSDGTVASSVKIASGTNGGPALTNIDLFGVSVANIGDLNGNGVTDIAVGAVNDDTGGTDRGAVHILFMNSDGTVASSVKIASGTNGGPALTDGDGFGVSVANIGDLDGAGGSVTALAVGAYADNTGNTDAGAVYILFMNSDGTVASSVKIASGTNGGPALANSDLFGVSVANIGDLNGNGVTDIAVGAYTDDTGGTNRGATYILFMNSAGTVASSVKIASGTNGGPTLADEDRFGVSIAGIGDLNGNGVTDIAVGAYTDDTGGTNRGATYILFMNSAGTVASSVKIASGTNGGPTLADDDLFGASVANIGDFNGNGINDLAVGAEEDDTGGTGRGATYILFMNSDGTVASSVKIASGTNGGPTLANSDLFGGAVANIGDFNGNGINDLAVGARGDDTGGTSRGAAYILFLTAITTTSTSSGGGPKGDVSAPSFGLDRFTFSRLFPESVLETIQDDPLMPIEPIKDETLALPLVINENGYAISKYANTIQTNTIDTGSPVNIKLNLDDETGIEHVALYTNLREDQREIQDSDTYIIFDEYKELEIIDPHQFFSFANVTVYENSTKYSINFNMTFAKPMEKSDIIFRIWDDRRNVADTKIFDAWEIVGEEITKEEQFSLLLAEPAVKQAESSEFALYDKEASIIMDKWAGYYAESASDAAMLKALGLEGSYMPHWTKRFFGENIHKGDLDMDDFVEAIKYLSKIGIVK